MAVFAVFRLPVSAADPDYTFSSGAVLLDNSYSGKNILIQNGVFSVTVSGATDVNIIFDSVTMDRRYDKDVNGTIEGLWKVTTALGWRNSNYSTTGIAQTCPLLLTNGASATVAFRGVNNFYAGTNKCTVSNGNRYTKNQSGGGFAGVQVDDGSTLTISPSGGTLNAYGAFYVEGDNSENSSYGYGAPAGVSQNKLAGGAGIGGGHDEREQTLNQLLVEMDGFTDNQGVIVIAATNRRDILDPALLRPGRFDRQITVGYPDIKGREAILRVHTKNKKLAPDISLATIAKGTAGFTGADLANLVNEAALLAARNNRKAITQPDIEEATIKVVAGPEKKSKVVSEEEKRLTAFHEAGHAVCTFHCKTQDPVHQVSIIPRGMAGGYTMSLPEHDRSFRSKTQMEEEIIVLLGGRVAEKIVLDEISTGASNDIERATDLARSMITRYGFSEKLGPIVYGHDNSEVFLGRDYSQGRNYSENVAAEIDGEIRELIDTSYENAKQILLNHRDQLDKVAHYLMEHEKIDGEDFYKLMNGESLDDNTAAPVSENSDTAPADCEDTAEATGDNNGEANE